MAAGLVGLFVLALAIPLAAMPSCEGSEAAREIEQLRDDACACADTACANSSIDRFISYLDDHRTTEYSPVTLERTKRAAIEIIECAADVGISDEKVTELTRALESMAH